MIKERLIQYIDSKGITKSFFEKSIKMGNGYINNVKSIGSDKLEDIINKYPDLNIDWLIAGHGTMEKTIALYNEGTPLYKVDAAAGFGNENFSIQERDIEARYKIKEMETATFMLHVRGTSMSPTYNNGDIIAVKTVLDNRSIQWGKPHLISSQSHGLLIKRIYDDGESIIAVSDNVTYKPIIIDKKEVDGIAFVMGSVKFEDY